MMPIQGTNAVEMIAYLPESTPYGQHPVTVTTATGTSNALTLTVVPRKPDGRKLWRFTMNDQLMLHRPALATDGTIYARSQGGEVVAITPSGELKWLRQLGIDWTPQIDVGADGTIYTGYGGTTIHALNPNGTDKWTYTEPNLSQGIVAGPNVGPDGNMYVVSHFPGHGIYSLDPQGNLRWTGSSNPYSPFAQQGQEIVFSATQLFFCVDARFDSFDFGGSQVFGNFTNTSGSCDCPQPSVGPNGDSYVEQWGQLMSFDPGGPQNWMVFGVGGSYLRQPYTGLDGTTYVMRNVFNTLHAVNPNGTTKWTYNHPDTLLNPVIDPTDQIIVIGGVGVGIQGPGFFLALDNLGNPLWQYYLPIEQYGPFKTIKVTPQGRVRFTPDGSVAYGMATGPSGYPGHSYLYALQIAPTVELGHALPGAAGAARLTATGALTAGSPLTVTVTGAAASTPVYVVVGATALSTPFLGGVLVPSPDLVVPAASDANGTLLLASSWPSGVPSDASFYLQAWMPDPTTPFGYAASNGVSMITP